MSVGPNVETCTVEVVRLPDDIDKWHFVNAFLQLRTDIFVDKMSWNLHVHDGLEFEQYDTLSATYVIAHEQGRIIGGARLIRADNRSGVYSYMIRDASIGSLDGLPPDLCTEPAPTDRKTWELTRFIASPASNCAKLILLKSNEFLKDQGAERCLFLGPPAFLRMAKSMNFAPRPLGPVVGNDDGRFLAFECPVV